ncbi:ATP-binding protein [Patescibacteria group bacterium]|nr:ATP-binding protein [Patescibacteria group bacterium]
MGKTTLLQSFLDKTPLKYRLDVGDNIKIQNLFESRELDAILSYAAKYELIAIDEAQKIPHIGIGLKMLVDHRLDLQIIVTGSSSFDLAGQIGEPLTGRKKTLTLFPISQLELKDRYSDYELKEKLEEFLIFGSYPEIITSESREEKIEKIEEIAHSYLLKDILQLERVKSSKILLDLLRLLAFQIGNEVSLNELGTQLGIDHKTVARYLDLFEKSFVLFNVRGFSRNLRKETSKKSKYYFYDTGVRNALIANFNGIELRNDIGQLWENFIFIERLKKRSYQNIFSNVYFWRTWDQKEIDIIEEREGKLFGFECKWRNQKVKAPKDWLEQYPEASFEVVSQKNYMDFIG